MASLVSLLFCDPYYSGLQFSASLICLLKPNRTSGSQLFILVSGVNYIVCSCSPGPSFLVNKELNVPAAQTFSSAVKPFKCWS